MMIHPSVSGSIAVQKQAEMRRDAEVRRLGRRRRLGGRASEKRVGLAAWAMSLR